MPAELSRRPLSQALVELTPWETAGGCGAPEISLGSFLLELSGTSVWLAGQLAGMQGSQLDAVCGRGAPGNPKCNWSPCATGTSRCEPTGNGKRSVFLLQGPPEKASKVGPRPAAKGEMFTGSSSSITRQDKEGWTWSREAVTWKPSKWFLGPERLVPWSYVLGSNVGQKSCTENYTWKPSDIQEVQDIYSSV